MRKKGWYKEWTPLQWNAMDAPKCSFNLGISINKVEKLEYKRISQNKG